MPEGAAIVSRPSRWGNPWHIEAVAKIGRQPDGSAWTAEDTVRWYGEYARRRAELEPGWLAPLRGHDLACWCPVEDEHGNRVPCHADVLLELANR